MNQQQRAVVQQALEVLKRCQMNEAYRNFQQESDTITALCQLLEQPDVPAGWKLMPVKPTERMVEAGLKAFEKRATSPTRAAWKAMLAAAPTQGDKHED